MLSHIVMLSEAKHLNAHPARHFAEFTLSEANGLRVTRWCHPLLQRRASPARLPYSPCPLQYCARVFG
jgi:hypothetical protein